MCGAMLRASRIAVNGMSADWTGLKGDHVCPSAGRRERCGKKSNCETSDLAVRRRAAPRRSAPDRRGLLPGEHGRPCRRRRGRRVCGRLEARGDSRVPKAASRRRLRAGAQVRLSPASPHPPAPAGDGGIAAQMRQSDCRVARRLPLARLRNALGNLAAPFGRRRQEKIGGGHRRHLDVQVDAVDRRPRNAAAQRALAPRRQV